MDKYDEKARRDFPRLGDETWKALARFGRECAAEAFEEAAIEAGGIGEVKLSAWLSYRAAALRAGAAGGK